MKKIFFVFSIFLALNSIAQVPQGINYQAVIRNTNGTTVNNSNVGIRMNILQGSAAGTVVYSETFSETTSNIGLVNFIIGQGAALSGTFSAINWGAGPYFLEVAADATGGTNYTVIGTQQMMSVPYALYAENSGAPGPQGATGPQGPQGEQGLIGLTGPAGATGLQGPQGEQGPIGLTGPAGATGVNGPQGPIGLTGPAGATGATGTQGPIGLTGPQGVQGQIGLTGATGPQGPQGEQGPIGLTGPQGPQGIQGLAGATGAAGPQGSQGPAGTNGLSAYQVAVNNGFVGTEAQWLASLQGAIGAQGLQGLAGATGVQGPQGVQGPIGLTGPQGEQGPIGLTGAQGPQGIQGTAGSQGAAGTNGLNALIKTTTEPAGANCTNGGTKIETGLDLNGNGVLDAEEVDASQTQYVCDGLNGISSFSNNGVYSGNSIISNDTISPLMKYIGNGQEGAFDCSTFSGTLSGEHFYTNFEVPANCTLQIGKAQTTIIHVRDTCFINGVINGNGGVVAAYNEIRDWIGAAGGCSSASICQSCGYGSYNWSYSPEPLNQLLGYGHTKTVSKWAGDNMTLNNIRVASFLGLKINGYSSNYVSCGNPPSVVTTPSTSQGGAGLVIICKNLVFNGQILLNGANGSGFSNGIVGPGGGGSLILSTENSINSTGSVSTVAGTPVAGQVGAGNGIYYFINF